MNDTRPPIRGLETIEASPRIGETLFALTRRSAEFHGHLCPGLAVGIIAASIAMEAAERAEDEELVAIVENDACGVDAVQAITGCTFGKGNLVFRDYGKSVFSFFYRSGRRALRLSLRPDVYKTDDRAKMNAYFAKVKNGTATTADTDEFWNNHVRRTREILERGRDIYTIEEIAMDPPENARIFDSVVCSSCGEHVMVTRTVKDGERALCFPCARREGKRDE
jgi:formylmethanofuran dehydrogenase subunit E